MLPHLSRISMRELLKLRESILVLATAVAVGATVPQSSSAFEGGGGRNSGHGSFLEEAGI
jgi:hypothetical protein